MPSPFPGMDPFIEHPAIFPDFHDGFIAALRELLQQQLPQPYYMVPERKQSRPADFEQASGLGGDEQAISERCGADMFRDIVRDIDGPLDGAVEVEPEDAILERQHGNAVADRGRRYSAGDAVNRECAEQLAGFIIDLDSVIERRHENPLTAFRDRHIARIVVQAFVPDLTALQIEAAELAEFGGGDDLGRLGEERDVVERASGVDLCEFFSIGRDDVQPS